MSITINIDNVIEYYNENIKTRWTEADFSNIRPPFNNFIMKFKMPDYIFVGDIGRMNHPMARSKWFSNWKSKKETMMGIDGWLIKILIVNDINFIDFSVEIFCDDNGMMQKVFNIDGELTGSKIRIAQKDFDKAEARGMIDCCTTILQPQLLALCFLHCKNVDLIEVDPNEKLPSRVKRHWAKKGKPPLEKYHVLNINPMASPKIKPKEYKESSGTQRGLTIYRGHFKDYTKGKGLFGKYKGVFWIESFLKGNKEFGEIDKDYNIKI